MAAERRRRSDGGFNGGAPRQRQRSRPDRRGDRGARRAGTHAEAEAGALAFLHDAQLPDGGFPENRAAKAESNVASTAWGVQGIWAAGGDPETWRTGGGGASEEPLDYMESLQQPDGHVPGRRPRQLGIWMTAYVLPAFAGRPAPTRSCRGREPAQWRPTCVKARRREKAAGAGGAGEGGRRRAARRSRAGVVAGGGGNGAPRLQPAETWEQGQDPRRGADRPPPGGRRGARPLAGAARRQPAPGRRGPRPPNRAADEADQEVGAVGAAEPTPSDAQRRRSGRRRRGAARRRRGPRRGDRRRRRTAREPAPTATGREVCGVVIGSADGGHGKLAFGAPGLRSAGSRRRRRTVAAARDRRRGAAGGLVLGARRRAARTRRERPA